MLQIHHLPVKSVKKFAVFNLCLILSVITLCNIFALNCFADEIDPTASATEVTSQTKEVSTEIITEPTDIPTQAPTELESSSDDDSSLLETNSNRFYFFSVIIILLIMMFLMILKMII